MKVAIFLIALLGVAAAFTTVGLNNAYSSPFQAKYRFNQLKKVISGELKNAAVTNKLLGATPEEVLNNFMDAQWSGSFSVGTPAQKMTALFDTGSSNLWFMGKNCWSIPCFTHTLFNSAKSSTFKSTGKSFSIQYGSGSTSGTLGQDVISVDGLEGKNAYVGVASTVSTAFSASQFNGIAGMGFQSISVDNATPFFNTLVDEGAVPEDVFCFYLTKDPNEAGSALVLGGVDNSFAASSFTNVPLRAETYWAIYIDGIGLAGNSTTQTNKQLGAIVDSGTSLLVGSTEVVQPIIDAIGTVDCNKISSYPNIDVTIGSNTFPIPPELYILNVEGECLLGVQSIDLPSQLGVDIILGDVFMRQYYTCFDGKNNQVSFATAK